MKRLTITAMMVVIALVYAVAVPACGKQMGYCFDAAFHEKTSRLFVAGGNQGTHVFEVTNGKFKFITTVADGSYHRNLKISGDKVYLADVYRGLVVFDITGREPVRTWQEQATSGLGIDVQGNYAYLAAGGDGLHIFDISTADAPKLTGKCKTNGDAWDVWVNGPYAYVADLQKGITVVDVSQPSQPRTGPSVTWDDQEPMAEIIRGEGKIVCVGAGKHGLVVADISNPQVPRVVSQYKSGDGAFGEGLCVKDGLVYLANGNKDNPDENGLIIVDARNPQALKVRGKCAFPGWVEGVCLAGHQAFMTNTRTGVRSIDVQDPDHPRLTDSFGAARRAEAVVLAAPKASAPPPAGIPRTKGVLELDGKTSFVRIADSPSLHTFTNAITIETRFQAASFNTAEQRINCLLRKNIGNHQENFFLRFRTIEGEPGIEMSPGLDIGPLRADYSFTVGKWYHLACVYDGDAITIYVNGNKVASAGASGRMNIDQSDLFLGRGDATFSGGEYFHGALDETRLWNVARSPEEIRAAMNTTLTGKEKGLVAYWSFDDGTAKDLSGHGNDGILVLQRYESSRKPKQPSDDPIGRDVLLGGHRHGRQCDYADQAGIDSFSAPV